MQCFFLHLQVLFDAIVHFAFQVQRTDKHAIQGNDEEHKANIKLSPQRTLDCTNCNSIIGMEDPTAKGWRLLKANVSLNTNSSSDADITKWEVHPTETIVAAQLHELIERESARRFVVHCGQKSGLVVGDILFHSYSLPNLSHIKF